MSGKFYITTPIYYVNDKPHIGHAYTTILADVLARYHRADGDDVFFLTGLDEHGQKVQQAAEKRNVDPQQHCDEMAPRFLELWDKLHISNDDFIRTTEQRHKTVVQNVLQKVYNTGDIYFDEYGGHYCVGCERFYTEKELVNGKCPQHEKELEYITEKNYFFRMSKYQQALIDHINDNPGFIQPEHRKNEILGFLKKPLGDLCISRPKTRLDWGIDLPFDNDYVTYVWFDALINYVTATGFGADEESYTKWWPCEYHLIGKDILTTHAVYWPTMLMSAKMPLPKSIFAHGWWLSGESKMSKSLGNVVNPLDLIEKYGVDPVRYYLMREMVLGQDASFTMESFIKRYNSDLANDFGNLLSRVSKLIEKNFDGIIPDPGKNSDAENTIQSSAEKTVALIHDLINEMKVNDAIEETMQFIRSVNKYMEQQAPWKLVKEDKVSAGRVLYTAAEALRIGTLLLTPVMPHRTELVLDTLNVKGTDLQWGGLKPGTTLKNHPPLFPRINIKKETQKQPKQSKVKTATVEDFEKLGLKTAEIISVEKVEKADKLYRLQIQLGDEKRQIVSGIADHYSPDELVGKMIVVVSNLEPATIRGVESKGMLLAASSKKGLSLIIIDGDKIESGGKVY